jgi:RNA polymerase sigma factor (TIGR02999 family)
MRESPSALWLKIATVSMISNRSGGTMGEVTQLLDGARQGDKAALERFYARIYPELSGIARSQLGRQSPLTLIDAPSLVNEVYLRIARQESIPGEDRGTFLGYAARVMRSVIIDYIRARGAERRGGDRLRVTLATNVEEEQGGELDFDELSAELEYLERIDERAYRVVELRFFGGMEIEEIARFLDTSPATVKRDWTKARMFLRHRLSQSGSSA